METNEDPAVTAGNLVAKQVQRGEATLDGEGNVTYVLAPITDRQALNVAMNVLHTVIQAAGIGPIDAVLRAEYEKAQPKDSDTRAAYKILERLCQAYGRDWVAPGGPAERACNVCGDVFGNYELNLAGTCAGCVQRSQDRAANRE
jgi:hypothetical protein